MSITNPSLILYKQIEIISIISFNSNHTNRKKTIDLNYLKFRPRLSAAGEISFPDIGNIQRRRTPTSTPYPDPARTWRPPRDPHPEIQASPSQLATGGFIILVWRLRRDATRTLKGARPKGRPTPFRDTPSPQGCLKASWLSSENRPLLAASLYGRRLSVITPLVYNGPPLHTFATLDLYSTNGPLETFLCWILFPKFFWVFDKLRSTIGLGFLTKILFFQWEKIIWTFFYLITRFFYVKLFFYYPRWYNRLTCIAAVNVSLVDGLSDSPNWVCPHTVSGLCGWWSGRLMGG